MTKKRYVNQYTDECSCCPHKVEKESHLKNVSFVVRKGQLYCSAYDEFMDIDLLKGSGIFCIKGRKKGF